MTLRETNTSGIERRAAPIIEAVVYGLVDEIEDNDWRESELADGRARFDPDFVRFVSEKECDVELSLVRSMHGSFVHVHVSPDHGTAWERMTRSCIRIPFDSHSILI